MKRKLLSLLCIVLPLFVMAQQKEFSHWSVVGGIGANVYDGDVSQTVTKALPHGGINLSWGLGLEYAITPIWGLSLEYYHLPYTGGFTDGIYNPFTFKTKTNNLDLNATVNFIKIFFPESRTKWHINGSLGVGGALYKIVKTNLNYADGTAISDGVYEDVSLTWNDTKKVFEDKYFNGLTIPVSLSTEYNFTKSFAAGIKLQYRTYNQDDLEGFNHIQYQTTAGRTIRKPWRGNANDMSEAGTIYLRYKINAINKDHLRNLSMKEYASNDELKKLQADVDALKNKVKDVDDKVDNLTPRVEKSEKTLSNAGPDTDADGVPDHRDLEPNTPQNTPVDFWGRTLILPNDNQNVDDIPAVYFDFDKTDLDDEALITIRKVSAKMKADPSLVVEVRGFCDYMGNNPYNDKLSIRRANKVKNEMIKVWGIEASRIIPNGKGRILNPETRYRPNRRCDFYFNK